MSIHRTIPMVVLGLLVLLGQTLGLMQGRLDRPAVESCVVDEELASGDGGADESCPCCTALDSCGCGMQRAPVLPRTAPEPVRLAGGAAEVKGLLPRPTGVLASFGIERCGPWNTGNERGAVGALAPSRARLCVRLT